MNTESALEGVKVGVRLLEFSFVGFDCGSLEKQEAERHFEHAKSIILEGIGAIEAHVKNQRA